jgi:uncharacterized protein
MVRAKQNIQINNFHTLASALVARMNLATSMGTQSYSGNRDIYQALGYLKTISYEQYEERYLRQDIAKAIIDRPVKATWQGKLELVESLLMEETPFEKAWGELNSKFELQSLFSRVDRLSSIGKYGIILLGLDDVRQNEDFRTPTKIGSNLVYLKAFSEGSAKITTYETDPNNARYGKPLIYTITIQELEGGVSMTADVHYSRIVHIVNDPLESDIECAPVLEVVFNRLMDLEKLVGGDAEMFWRGARPGYSGNVDKDFQMTSKTKQDLKDQIDEFEHNLRRILISEGLDLKSLDQQIADPKNHAEVQLMMISAVTGIPKRILVGSERGELSSAQDVGEWKTYVMIRRQEHAEPHIIRPFVKACQTLRLLPNLSTNKYSINWEDLFALSEADRVKIGKDRATAIRDYTISPIAEAVLPPQAFLELGLGLSSDQINMVRQMIGSEVEQERKIIEAIEQQSSTQQEDYEQPNDEKNE